MTHLALPLARTRAHPRVAFAGAGVAGLMAVAHVANDTLTSMLSALLPSLQGQFGLSPTMLALLVAVLAFSSSVTQPLFGALSDRFGARRVAALGTAFGVSLMSLMTVAPSVAILFALLLVGGLGSAAFHPAGASAVGAAPLRRKELAIGLFSAAGTIGLALGPVLILLAAASFGVRFTPWLILPAVALGAATYAFVPETPAAARERRPLLDRSLFAGPVGVLATASALASVASVTFTAAFPLFLVSQRGMVADDPLLGATLAVFNLSAAGGAVVTGVIGHRVDRRLLVPGTIAAATIPLTGLLALDTTTPLYFVAVAAAGGLLNASLPTLLVAAHELAPDRKAAASGMLMGLPMGLAGLIYVGVGALQEAIGLAPAMATAFGAVIPAAVLALAVLRGMPGPLSEMSAAAGAHR